MMFPALPAPVESTPVVTPSPALAQQAHMTASKKKAVLSLALSDERARVEKRVAGFAYRKSPVWKHLCHCYGPKLRQEELVSIADLLCAKLNIKLDRDARRRKVVIVKWFEEHWHQVQHVLPNIVLEP